MLRGFCRWAVAEKSLRPDPTEGIKVSIPPSDGWHTMTDAEREQYKVRHDVGTLARAAYAVLHFTGLRVSDGSKFREQHLTSDGGFRLKAQKNGADVVDDVEAEMMEAIQAYPKPKAKDGTTTLAFLVNKFGKQFTPRGSPMRLSNRASRRACRIARLTASARACLP